MTSGCASRSEPRQNRRGPAHPATRVGALPAGWPGRPACIWAPFTCPSWPWIVYGVRPASRACPSVPSPAFRELLLIICLLINHAYALAIVCQSAFVFISCLHLFYELITACFSEMGKASYLSSEMKFSQKRALFKIDN